MTAYALYILDLTQINTPEKHNEAMSKPPHRYFDKLRDVEDYIGAKLPRHGFGYSGTKGDTEYVALKVTVRHRCHQPKVD